MKPTDQQLNCITAAVQYAILKIEAGAGSGKTSTLKLVSETLTKRSLYVAFNKVTAVEATEKFPSHVTCKTTHSLAYAKFGTRLRDKLNRPKGGYVNVAFTGSEIARFYKMGCITDEFGIIVTTDNAIGLFVRQTVEKFEQSADAELSIKHIPRFDMQKTLAADKSAGEYVLRLAKRLWADRIDKDSKVMATHDTYLKLFQLSKPRLGFDVVYLDESQDSTPCVLDIVMSQAAHGAKIILVGDRYQAIYCQPAGTMVRRIVAGSGYKRGQGSTYEDVPIEQITQGDLVLSYDISKSHLHKAGKPVSRVGSRNFEGQMITVQAKGKTSKYTEDHHVIVRLGDTNVGKQVVYLMRKGDKFRVGVAPWRYNGGMFGAGQRASAEGASELWLLGVFDTVSEALMWENLYSYRYGVPQVCFKDRSNHAGQVNGEKFWEMFGDNVPSAEALLGDLNLCINEPLWGRKKTGSMQAVKMRSNFVTTARNLVTGMHCAVMDANDVYNFESHSRIGLKFWHPIEVSSESVQCRVYSLEVADDHTYFADDILTHNCWRGAVNAMQQVDGHTTLLSKSFRFGQAVADVATAVLQGKMQLTGREDLKSVIGRVDRSKPYMYLFRTNGALLYAAVAAISKGEDIRLEVDVNGFLNLLKSVFALSNGDMKNVKHENVLPYPTWEEYKEEAKRVNGEMKRLVSIIDGGDYYRFCNVLEGFVNPEHAHTVFTTAHKSKGREHEQVVLADDFPSPYDEEGGWIGLHEMEENLLYVAVTRAMGVLELNNTARACVDYYRRERFAYDVTEDDDLEEDRAGLDNYIVNGNKPMLMPDIRHNMRRLVRGLQDDICMD